MRKASLSILAVCLFALFAGQLTSWPQVDRVQTKVPRLQPRPDLVVADFQLSREYETRTLIVAGRRQSMIEQRYSLTIRNAGAAPITTPFRIYFLYEVPGRNTYHLQTREIASEPARFVTVDRLATGERKTLLGSVLFGRELMGNSGRIYAVLDMVDEDLMAAHGRVLEMNESNNLSAKIDFSLPAAAIAKPAPSLQMQPTRTVSLTEELLDIIGGAIRGRIHINNDNGHSDSDHFTPNNPFRANDCLTDLTVVSQHYSNRFNFPEIYFERAGCQYHYYLRDLDCILLGGAGERGRRVLGIQDGKLVLRLDFETGGRVELRGWEYTAGTFYDLSAPDIDITRLIIHVSLTPALIDGIFTYSDVSVTPDLDVRFTGALDTVFMNDTVMRIRSAIRGNVQTALRNALLDEAIRQAFGRGATEEIRSFFSVDRLVSMNVEPDRISFVCR